MATCPDRLARFGLKYIEKYLNYCGVSLEFIKRRVEDLLHKASAIIVSEAVKFGARIVLEDLKHIRFCE